MPLRHPSLLLLAGMAMVASILFAGCSKAPDIAFAATGVNVPDYSEGTAGPVRKASAAGRLQEGLTIKSSKINIAQRYIEWFQTNGWKVFTQSQDVNALHTVLTKDNLQASVTYAPRDGTYLQISKPEAAAKP